MFRMFRSLAMAVAAIGFSAMPAISQTAESAYTALDLDKCHHSPGKADEDYGVWRCNGYAGIPVYVTAADQRSYVSFGRKAKDELAAKQTLAAFNGEGKTIEWRSERTASGRAMPFATIMRWSTTISSGDEQVHGQVLVVTRLAPGPVCHVGYVDVRANRDANAMAQKIADEHARNFRCGADKPVIFGNQGPGFSGPNVD